MRIGGVLEQPAYVCDLSLHVNLLGGICITKTSISIKSNVQDGNCDSFPIPDLNLNASSNSLWLLQET